MNDGVADLYIYLYFIYKIYIVLSTLSLRLHDNFFPSAQLLSYFGLELNTGVIETAELAMSSVFK